MESNIKHNTCRNKNPTAINGEHNITRSYPCINALHCLENLYAVILSFVSQVNPRKDFNFHHLENQEWDYEVACQPISPVKLKYTCINFHAIMSHTHTHTHTHTHKSPANLQLARCATSNNHNLTLMVYFSLTNECYLFFILFSRTMPGWLSWKVRGWRIGLCL